MGRGEFPGSTVHTDGRCKEVYWGGDAIAQKIWMRCRISTGGNWEGEPMGRKLFRLDRRDSRLKRL